jgi:hypothetical protein
MKLRLILSVVAVVLASTALAAVPASAACASNHIQIALTSFAPEGATRSVYFVAEDAATTSFTMRAGGDACDESAKVTYALSGGTAGSGDYQLSPNPGIANFYLPPHQSDSRNVTVTINNDDSEEAHVESAQIQLSNPQNAGLGAPATAPILIIDNEGAPRAGFEGTQHTQSESVGSLRIPVFLAGDAAGSVGFSIAPDATAPAAPGEDFQGPTNGTLNLSPSDRVGTIDLTITNDTVAEASEGFIVSLSGPIAPGAGQMKVTITDNEENAPPSSKFHHPRHKWRYKKSDYRIREFHVFAHDNPGGAGLVGAELALKRTRSNGTCQWLTRSGWQSKDCQNRTWLTMKYDPVGELFLYRMKQLKSSVGTKVKNYTAFSRAIDGSGNVESEFKEKRNANTFEIKRTRRRR